MSEGSSKGGIEVRRGLTLRRGEYWFRSSTSGGPGGQHVNRVQTRVTLCFDVAHCSGLSSVDRAKVIRAYPGRVSLDGVMRVVCCRHRSQYANRRSAVEKLVALLTEALAARKGRRPTSPTRASQERRLREKRQRQATKSSRARPAGQDD